MSACGSGGETTPAQPTATKPGVLAISALPRLDPFPATAAQYVALATEAFDLVYGAGARGQMTTFTWSALEPTQGTYDASKFGDLAAAIDQAQSHAMTQFVGIQIINTTAREVPADLAGQAFDSPAVTSRFRSLLDRVVAPNRGKIRFLSIGNEVDAYLRANPAQWANYKRFYADATQYAHSLDPAIQVGVTGTADGALTLSATELQDLNAGSDVMILTYYPLQSDASGTITVRDPGVVAGDFNRMLQFAGGRRLVMQEVGYPASTLNSSSEGRIQPVDATVWLNISAGVWKPRVFLGLWFNCLATALSLACE